MHRARQALDDLIGDVSDQRTQPYDPESLPAIKKLPPKIPAMFRVEFAVHMKYDKGETSFRREEELPFAPFVGLDVLDDALGEFQLKHVAWAGGDCKMFLCQGNVGRKDLTIRQACKFMKKGGWEEDKESRMLDD